MKKKIILAMYRREAMKMWAETKKVWVRREARKLAARGITPVIQELGLVYDEAILSKRGKG